MNNAKHEVKGIVTDRKQAASESRPQDGLSDEEEEGWWTRQWM